MPSTKHIHLSFSKSMVNQPTGSLVEEFSVRLSSAARISVLSKSVIVGLIWKKKDKIFHLWTFRVVIYSDDLQWNDRLVMSEIVHVFVYIDQSDICPLSFPDISILFLFLYFLVISRKVDLNILEILFREEWDDDKRHLQNCQIQVFS